jgi:hypothetical protein
VALIHWFHELRVKRGVSWWKIPIQIRSVLLFSSELKSKINAIQWHDSCKWNPIGSRISIGPSFLSSEFTFSSLHYIVADNVNLVGEHATPILSSGNIVLTSKRDSPSLFLEEINSFVACTCTTLATSESSPMLVLSLASRLDMVYYHWITEQLPQVFALIDACKSLEKTPVVYLRKQRPAFQDTSLKTLFPDIEIADYGGELNVPHLLLSTIPTKGYAAHPVVLRLREHAFSMLGDVSRDGPLFIYVKRKIGGWRYILNEDEVLDTLRNLGFTIIDAAEYSFVEQVQLFSSARCVISIFGSGLTNILFCTGATIVELAGYYADPCFASISGHVGNKHIRLKCVSSGDNIIVNVDELSALLGYLTSLEPQS